MPELLFTLLFCITVRVTHAAEIFFTQLDGNGNISNFSIGSFMFDCADRSQLYCLGDVTTEWKEMRLTETVKGANVSSVKDSTGAAFFASPIRMKDRITNQTASFSTNFTFTITNQSTLSQSSHYGLTGDGFMFVMLANASLAGENHTGGGGLGIFQGTTGMPETKTVALEFDTFMNGADPIFDKSANHVGLDLESIHSRVTTDLDAYGIHLASGESQMAWIDYYAPNVSSTAKNGTLQVRLGDIGGARPSQPMLDYSFNLAEFVDEYMWVGFSGATGYVGELHTINTWGFSSYGLAVRDASPPKIIEGPGSSTIPSPSFGGYAGSRGNGFPPAIVPAPLDNVFSPLDASNLRLGDDHRNKLAIIIGLFVAIPLNLTALLCLFWWKRARNATEEESTLKDLELQMDHVPRRFKYKDLKVATNGFSDRSKLGQGGFGSVYHGALPRTGAKFAVKRVNNDTKQGGREFIAEISIISRLSHRNLVKLLGWCADQDRLLLVYELMPRRSLDQALFGHRDPGNLVLSWPQRFNIVNGVAAGLHYLHEGWEQQVIHRDVKASNVMLDAQFNAKLGDFGLARLVEHHKKPHTTQLAGTFGYIAPEAAVTGKYTAKTDVYSFGALTLEIACGRRPIEREAMAEETILVDWVWTCHNQGNILNAADMQLGGSYDTREMEMTLLLGLLCSNPDPGARPSMRQVVQILAGDLDLPSVPISKPVAVWQYKYPYPTMTLNELCLSDPISS